MKTTEIYNDTHSQLNIPIGTENTNQHLKMMNNRIYKQDGKPNRKSETENQSE
ncbi:MAG: hypothetical protein V3U80_08935 [Flavobacteriaceae bacterium]